MANHLVLFSLFLFVLVLQSVESKKYQQVIKVKHDGAIQKVKTKAEMLGMASGASVGFGKALLKKEIKEPVIKEIYTEYKPKSPHFKVKWVEEKVPMLVEIPDEQPKKLYTKKVKVSYKKSNLIKAGLFPYIKGYFKGKFAAKSVSKVLKD